VNSELKPAGTKVKSIWSYFVVINEPKITFSEPA
jgi:hypothetical protein